MSTLNHRVKVWHMERLIGNLRPKTLGLSGHVFIQHLIVNMALASQNRRDAQFERLYQLYTRANLFWFVNAVI